MDYIFTVLTVVFFMVIIVGNKVRSRRVATLMFFVATVVAVVFTVLSLLVFVETGKDIIGIASFSALVSSAIGFMLMIAMRTTLHSRKELWPFSAITVFCMVAALMVLISNQNLTSL